MVRVVDDIPLVNRCGNTFTLNGLTGIDNNWCAMFPLLEEIILKLKQLQKNTQFPVAISAEPFEITTIIKTNLNKLGHDFSRKSSVLCVFQESYCRLYPIAW